MFYLQHDPQLVAEMERLRALSDAALHDIITVPRAHDDVTAVFNILTTQPAYLQVVLERANGSALLLEMVNWAMMAFANQPHELTQLWAVWWLVQSDKYLNRREQAQAMAMLGLYRVNASELVPYDPANAKKRGVGFHVAIYCLLTNGPDLQDRIVASVEPNQRPYLLFETASIALERGEVKQALSLLPQLKEGSLRCHLMIKIAGALPMQARVRLLYEALEIAHRLPVAAQISFMGQAIPLFPTAEAEVVWRHVFQVANGVDLPINGLAQLAVAVKADPTRTQLAVAEMFNRINALPDQTVPDDSLLTVTLALAVLDHPDAIPYLQKWFERVIAPMDFFKGRRRLETAAKTFADEGLIQYAVTCAASIKGDAVHSDQAYWAVVEAMVKQGYIDEAIALADSLDVTQLRPTLLNQIALTAARRNDPRALEIFEMALESYPAAFDREALKEFGLWLARHNQGQLAYQLGQEPHLLTRGSFEEDFAIAVQQQHVKLALQEGDIPAALTFARSLEVGKIFREESLRAIAISVAAQHGVAAARQIIDDELHPNSAKSEVWRDVGIELGKRGEITQAILIAAQLRGEAEQTPSTDPFLFWGMLMNVVGEATGKVEETNSKLAEMRAEWQADQTHQRDYAAWETKAREEDPAALDQAIVAALTAQGQLEEALIIARRLHYLDHRCHALCSILTILPPDHPQCDDLLQETLGYARQIEKSVERHKAIAQTILVMIEKGRLDQVAALTATLDQATLNFVAPFLQALAPATATGLMTTDKQHSSEFMEVIEDLLDRGQLDAVGSVVQAIHDWVSRQETLMSHLAHAYAKQGRWKEAFATLETLLQGDHGHSSHQLADYLATIARWDMPPETMLAVLRIIGWGRLRWQRIYELVAEAGLT